MTEVTYEETLHDISDVILNEEFTGFKEDYLVLHSLLRKYRPKSYFEIGTNMGTGLNIACNAIYNYHFDAKIYSLDLPTELVHISLQHPISEGKGDRVGQNCKLPYIQLRGDSTKFDYSQYPCEAYFIDGEHDYYHVRHESAEVMKLKPKIVIFHDSDIEVVWRAIEDTFRTYSGAYELYRVDGTRISYILKQR